MTKHTILFLAANPAGTDRLALDKEARSIQAALDRSRHRDKFELVTRWAAQPLDLLEELRKLKPTVVHFSGHGSRGESGEPRSGVGLRREIGEPGGGELVEQGGLFFQGPDGQPQLVSTAALEETFGAAGSSVKLVVLNACYSETQAAALVACVGCVVGMHGSIRDDAARNFATGFYGGLGDCESVAAAYRHGCAAIGLEGLPEGNKPQLSVRDGIDAELVVLAALVGGDPAARSRSLVSPTPAYANAELEALSKQLEDTRARRQKLRDAGIATDDVDQEILTLRRRLREGGQLHAGDSLSDDRYLLVKIVGRGGFAVVWEAYDRITQQRVAIKVLHTNLAGDPQRRERFLRGAQAMMRLSHPAVTRVLDLKGEDEGFYYFVMEYVSGGNLREAVLDGRVPNEGVLQLILQIGEALVLAHAHGMVHRDIKPSNILLDAAGSPKLTDFDLVSASDTTGGTRTGALGTVVYAAPECLDRPQEATTRADVYGLGMTAIFCLSGQDLSMDTFRNPEVTILKLDCSISVRAVLRQAVAWRPGERHADATAMMHELRSASSATQAAEAETTREGDLNGRADNDDLLLEGTGDDQPAMGTGSPDETSPPRLARAAEAGTAARGWPSMQVLFDQRARAQRRSGFAIAAAAAIVALVVTLLLPGRAPTPICEAPSRDVNTVWSPAIRSEFAARTSAEHVAVLDMAYWNWRAVRSAACHAPPQIRMAQLQCLDGALGRFDGLRQGFARARGAPAEAIQGQIVDPAICRKPAAQDIPKLTLTATPELVATYAMYGRSYIEPETRDARQAPSDTTARKPSDTEIASLLTALGGESCARVVASLAFERASSDVPRMRQILADAISAADQCGDERLRADLMIRESRFHWEQPIVGPKGAAAMRLATTAAAHVMQPDVEATLAGYAAAIARQTGRFDEALRLLDTQIAGYQKAGLPRRTIQAVIYRNNMRLTRSDARDLEDIRRDVKAWRSLGLAHQLTELVRRLDVQDAVARYTAGDLTAHADLIKLWETQPPPERTGRGRRITGQVVDAHGRPVAGARVAASGDLRADSIEIGVPSFYGYLRDDDLRIATSDDSGQFAIEDILPEGVIAAQLGDRRSRPAAIADHVRLVLEPTRTVSGKIKLGTTAHTRIVIDCGTVGDPTGRMEQIAPVAADGSFSLAGASIGALRIGAMSSGTDANNDSIEYIGVPASTAPVTGLSLWLLQSQRTVDVVVRSSVATSLEGGQVILLSGRRLIRNLGELIRAQSARVQTHMARPTVGESVPRAVLDKVRSGDIVAHVEHAIPGEITACAVGLSGDLQDPDYVRTLRNHLSQLAVKCEYIGPAESVVVLAVPPQQRFDEK